MAFRRFVTSAVGAACLAGCASWLAIGFAPAPPSPPQMPGTLGLRPAISALGTAAQLGPLPPRLFGLRSLKTLRAGYFRLPVLAPRDFAVGPLAVAPIDIALELPEAPAGTANEPDALALDEEGGALRGRLKQDIAGWPRANRGRKSDLDMTQSHNAVDPADDERELAVTVLAPFEREPAPVSRRDGASPAALAPHDAAVDARTTGASDLRPLEVAAVPVVLDRLPEPIPALEPGEGLTTVPRLVGTDDGLARPLDLPPVAYTRAHQCLAVAIYHEARGESVTGQIAVAQVVINRVRSAYYPHDVCSVVYQNATRRNACQFSFACDGIRDREDDEAAWRQAESIAYRVMDGQEWLPEVGNATHYHATYVSPRWVRDMVQKDRIGRHIFYRVRWWG